MNTKTGDILTESELEKYIGKFPGEERFIRSMRLAPTAQQLKRKPISSFASGRIGRNDPCPCGSGKKFKKCCLVTKNED